MGTRKSKVPELLEAATHSFGSGKFDVRKSSKENLAARQVFFFYDCFGVCAQSPHAYSEMYGQYEAWHVIHTCQDFSPSMVLQDLSTESNFRIDWG